MSSPTEATMTSSPTFNGYYIGDNRLIGGRGNDTFLVDRWGDDSVTGGGGANTLSFANEKQGVSIDLASGFASFSFAGRVTGSVSWASMQNLVGSAGNDRLTGD